MINNSEKIPLVEIIRKLFINSSTRRKRQMDLLNVLILVSNIEEILTNSSIIKFKASF